MSELAVPYAGQEKRTFKPLRAPRGEFSPEGLWVIVSHFQLALNELHQLQTQATRAKAEHIVDEAIGRGRLARVHREWGISYCQADRNGFAKFIAREPTVLDAAVSAPREPASSRRVRRT
jgi:hypothetical protein